MRYLTAVAALGLVLAVTGTAGATTWQRGWNDMATVSGGTVSPSYRPSGALEYVQIQQANVTWDAGLWSDVFVGTTAGDQYFFDGAIRNTWYEGAVPTLTAYDWNGTSGVPDGTYEWLVNNYARDGSGNPIGNPKNSHIRGSDSSLIYDDVAGTFEAYLPSDGTWYWYTPSTPDSPMSAWAGMGLFMSGNFRLVGNFTTVGSDIVIQEATLQHELVPEPVTMAGLIFGVGSLVGYVRRRRKA
jgi:hypothetical protein